MQADGLTPVTVLCGFLGAGKTTLLRHLLAQTEGERWALIVNDVGSINLDARLVSEGPGSATAAGAVMMELGNGCVCCSNKDDLAETLCRLGAKRSFDHILLETTGIAEPQGIANLFLRRNPFGRSVADFARLQNLVTVIDSADFLRRWRTRDREPIAPGAQKPLFELLVEQVEGADALLLNKTDLINQDEQAELEGILSGLNERAEQLSCEQSQAPREWLLDKPRFSAATPSSARWIAELNRLTEALPGFQELRPEAARRPSAERLTPAYQEKYGLRSFAFQARQPFDGARLKACLETGLPGIVRAKGFFWLKERPDEMAFLSIAGGAVTETWLNYWWAAMIENGKAALADRPPLIRALWQEPAGDRRQELVFIGLGYDEAALRRRLEACLA